MTQVFKVYCDESCHLERDRQGIMVLGAIWCPLEETVVQRHITVTDKQIDQLVCEPYSLTDEGMRILKEATR